MKGLLKILSVLLITALAVSVATAQAPTINTMKARTELSAKVQAIYTSQIGVRELTGRNDGPEVRMYLQSVGLREGHPWCAAFVRWVYDKANIKTNINAMAMSADRRANRVYFARRFIEEPIPGDVFTLYYASLKRIGHVGFYDGRQNKTIFRTVEGNTNGAGSREGNGVYRKYRSFNGTHSINSFIRAA